MTTDNKTAPVDVLQWLGDERFMYGPDTESRAKCEESRAAVADLIAKAEVCVAGGYNYHTFLDLSGALARVKGELA